ncbi:MAG: hypothetical protein GY714_32165 [Desulfobacterales bacterium]|nr:hypothetical protein [Desulfobacterales bacterium]
MVHTAYKKTMIRIKSRLLTPFNSEIQLFFLFISMVLFSYSCNTTNTYVSKIDIKKIDKVKPLKMVIQTGHNAFINSISFSPRKKIIATVANDGTIKLWTYDGNLIKDIPTKLSNLNVVKFSPDGNYLAVCTSFSFSPVTIWNLKGKKIASMPHSSRISHIKFTHDGKQLITIVSDKL